MTVADKMIEMIDKSSMIRKMFEEGAKLKAKHGSENVYDFSLGNPDVPPPPEFKKVLRDLVNDDSLNHGYTPSPGLPQVRQAVADFVSDSSPRAYESVVDRLLASPAYAERMAMYWLDLVRFADTVGYHGDQPHSIWPYRDYVIHAFDSNLPFDQFTRVHRLDDELIVFRLDVVTLIISFALQHQ